MEVAVAGGPWVAVGSRSYAEASVGEDAVELGEVEVPGLGWSVAIALVAFAVASDGVVEAVGAAGGFAVGCWSRLGG